NFSVDVVLSEFASLDGVVTEEGRPADDITIAVTAQAQADSVLTVRSGPDGRFRFDRLAADTYRVSAVKRLPRSNQGYRSQLVTLAPGQNGQVTLELNAEGVTLSVWASARRGSYATAQVYIVQGAVEGLTAGAIRAAIAALAPPLVFDGLSVGG